MIMLFLSITYSLLFSVFSYAQSSVLATGEWYKIATTRTGLHKINATFLKDAGIDVTKLNPQNIRIFGNGGGVLPQANNALRAKDLTENFIEIVGENDGKFDATDYIIFYTESPHRVLYNTNNQQFTHQNNPYSDTTFVFLNISDTKGLRIKNQTLVSSTNNIKSFDDFTFHEIDQKNVVSLGGRDLGGSGREWYGESFGVSPDISFDLKTEGIIPNSSIKLTSAILGASFTATKVSLKLNADSLIGEQSLRAIGTGTYDIKGNESIQTFTAISNGKSTQKLTFSFNKNNQNSSVAYLNYFEVQTQRKLQFYEQQTLVRSIESLGNKTSNFLISQAGNTHKIWDVTNPLLPENIPFRINNSEANFSTETQSKLKTFVLFSTNNLLEPNSIQKVNNQNLQQTQTPDLLILTIKNWHEQAERLAAFRRTNDGLTVTVVDINEVYNEFSSGSPDPTAIRDFGRFLWQKNPTKLKYVLLFADASFDYKNIIQYASIDTKLQIPTYESRESLNPVNSYASDDYFGFFEDNEGEWQENNAGNHSMEIGVGRLPVKSIEEAKNVVDKLIYYARTQRTAGSWRRKISFVADDGDFNIHQQDADDISEVTLKTTKDLIINKIYLDAFPQIATANGAISPEVNKALNKSVNEGALIINYSGHGGTDGWTEEKVLTRDQIQSWRNLNNMPLFLTATCSFGRFDDPGNVSGAEMAMLSPRGAAIGLLTTTRPVYSNTNFLLNNAFYQAFAQKNTNPNLRLGDIFRITKNNSLSGVFNRNFSLLGDPSMQLAYPTDKVVLSKINGNTPEKQIIKALSKVSLEGEIINSADGLRKNNFNGKILVSVFDKPSEVTTLGQKTEKFRYKTYRIQIFEGLVEVKNGAFKVNFVVPKDINYQVGAGRVNFYAISADSTLDASGSYNELMIGSSETNILGDMKAPEIELSIDKNNILEAKISDENGINISQAGVGHEMILVLNDTLQIIANQYFTNKDDYTKGVIKYNFGKLPAGQYTVRLKVWDTYNNSAEEALKFVVGDEQLKILRAYNYPNPVESSTSFYIEHNAENQDLTFTLTIFDGTGKQVFEQTETCYLCDKSLNLGMKIEPKNWKTGIYFYRISVDSVSEKSTSSFSGKMVFWK
ncbi:MULTISPECIES: type IX secretion system sortase PorU [Emticicia]|uniref:type IX secretion system sortase PorU n=1 Tax=Emticicia TaxID=312278 RepID=UPI0007D8C343|nr:MULTISPECIES: type IX secretion system sortase PorU [Emticicia]